MNSLCLYFRYIGVSIRSQMQYKASFIVLSVGELIVQSTECLAIWALFDRFKFINGWTFPEIAMLYGIVHIAFALSQAVARGFDMFGNLVKSGDFDRLLLRPRSTSFQLFAQDLQMKRVGRLAQGLGILLWGVLSLNITWTISKVALLITAIIGGASFFSGLYVLQATLAFWTVEGLEVANTMTDGGVETAKYPISIYKSWLREFFTFVVPLAFVNYYPSLAILDRPGYYPFINWIAPVIGVAFLVISLQVWKLGVRHYCSTGS
jgi:ABC-2 type transport system permease protein